MSESQSFSQYTSHHFEQEVLNRFRSLVKILPSECKIYRETWNTNTVLCLDFHSCPHYIEIVKEDAIVLTKMMMKLSLSKSIIFRQGHQIKAWRNG